MNEEERLLYSLLVIKEVLEESNFDEEIDVKSNGNKCTFNFYEEIKKCVVDHVNNLKPLKFEELKEKTWYWHEPSKSWIYLYKPLDWEPIKGLRYGERIINHSVEVYYMDFKEGTLFRKQVKE